MHPVHSLEKLVQRQDIRDGKHRIHLAGFDCPQRLVKAEGLFGLREGELCAEGILDFATSFNISDI